MTKADKGLIFVFVVLSAACLIYLAAMGLMNRDAQRYVSVQVNGKEVQHIPLDASSDGKHFLIQSEFGRNVLSITGDAVEMFEASCPDQLCIRQGRIDKVGQMLVCLPNRTLVEIKGRTDAPDSQSTDTNIGRH